MVSSWLTVVGPTTSACSVTPTDAGQFTRLPTTALDTSFAKEYNMKKFIIMVALSITLIFGMATPASAHHTHSPTTKCRELITGGFWEPNSTLVWAHSHYSSTGHPTYAHCLFRDRTTFQTHQRCLRYTDHQIVSVSTYCPGG